MDWIFDSARQPGAALNEQGHRIELDSFDFLRAQRFGLGRIRRPRVAIGFNASPADKGLAFKNWHWLCRLLCEKMDAGLILTGKKGSFEFDSARDLRGRFTQRETAAMLSRCDLLISEDTELIELAAAVDTPAVQICTNTWDQWQAGPGSKIVSVCPQTAEDIFDAIKQMTNLYKK